MQQPGLRVILISGFADALERAQHLKAKVSRVVAKPVTLEGIRAAVKAALRCGAGHFAPCVSDLCPG